MRLLLDSDAGTLTVKKNGSLLGTPFTMAALRGDVCWAVSSHLEDQAGRDESVCRVRIEAVDPEDF